MKEERRLRGSLACFQMQTDLDAQLSKTDMYRTTLASARPNKRLTAFF